ncbi:MAG TPA: hypothetical protein VFK19_11600 [Sphingomicrobium sp.]|nr:hypothetical protein [Sphingomicrobium sp.]
MILFMAATAALLQWTGPHTEQYTGPGYFCGGGYAVRLGQGERALVLPQGSGAEVQGVRLVLSRGEVNIWTGARQEAGRIVLRQAESAVTEQDDGNGVSYIVSNDTDFGLRLTSAAFRGFKQDKWFFKQADFSAGVDDAVSCLAAVSY